MQGCTYVHHVASPFPSHASKDEEAIIRPAREGTLRILVFARDAGVKKVIMTSSFAAIGYGYDAMPAVFTEDNWSILDGKKSVPAYQKSKALAERAAWDMIEREGRGLELTVLNPTGVFGPILSSPVSSSIQIIQALMTGKVPACPQLSFGVVDVRDLAALHILAMMSTDAGGQRFIATCDDGPVAVIDIANLIRKHRLDYAQKLPSRVLPNGAVRFMAWFSSRFREMLPELGVVKRISNDKAKRVLGWSPRSIEECISDTADSLIERKLV
jgi:nucleoside-diphosphate-sugar epimerase